MKEHLASQLCNALAAAVLLLTGLYFLVIALRSMYDRTGSVNPEVSLLLFPGVIIVVLAFLPLLTLLLVRREHAKGLKWGLTIASGILAYLVVSMFFL